MLCAREYEYLLPVSRADLVRQQLAFALAVDGVDDLGDALGRRIAAGDLDRGGRVADAFDWCVVGDRICGIGR